MLFGSVPYNSEFSDVPREFQENEGMHFHTFRSQSLCSSHGCSFLICDGEYGRAVSIEKYDVFDWLVQKTCDRNTDVETMPVLPNAAKHLPRDTYK